MGEFLSDASHELRTPIAGLQASAETLLRSDGGRAQRDQLTVQMIRQAARGGRLVDDLLSLSRLDDDPALELSQFDLAVPARDELARTEVLAPALELRYEGPTGALPDRRWPRPDRPDPLKPARQRPPRQLRPRHDNRCGHEHRRARDAHGHRHRPRDPGRRARTHF